MKSIQKTKVVSGNSFTYRGKIKRKKGTLLGDVCFLKIQESLTFCYTDDIEILFIYSIMYNNSL